MDDRDLEGRRQRYTHMRQQQLQQHRQMMIQKGKGKGKGGLWGRVAQGHGIAAAGAGAGGFGGLVQQAMSLGGAAAAPAAGLAAVAGLAAAARSPVELEPQGATELSDQVRRVAGPRPQMQWRTLSCGQGCVRS
jgi:hypothetical protein